MKNIIVPLISPLSRKYYDYASKKTCENIIEQKM